MKIQFNLTEINGEPALWFEDGTVVFQNETVGEFLRVCDVLSLGMLGDSLIISNEEDL